MANIWNERRKWRKRKRAAEDRAIDVPQIGLGQDEVLIESNFGGELWRVYTDGRETVEKIPDEKDSA